MKTIFPVLIILLVACNRPGPAGAPAPAPEKQAGTALFTTTKLHTFSQPGVLDTFRLTVTGKDFLRAQVSFEIRSGAGVIYREQFDSNYLIGYGIEAKADSSGSINDSIRVAYIQDRLRDFFNDKNFRTPAIKPGAVFEPQYTSRELFDELKVRPEASSFYYLLGKEDGRYIAWSKKSGKVMMFYNCC